LLGEASFVPHEYSVMASFTAGARAAIHSFIRGMRRTAWPIHDSSTYAGSYRLLTERNRCSAIASLAE